MEEEGDGGGGEGAGSVTYARLSKVAGACQFGEV